MGKTIRQEPILITLCSRCASQFYNTGRYTMQRADLYQHTKETCTYCGYRSGYDYLLYPKKERIGQDRRMRRYKGGKDICCVRTEY